MDSCCAVVDLRQYTLHPDRRDDLVEVFDRSFVEGQEAVGMHVVGQFRDLDRPDRFVWLRGFTDLPSRGRALTEFYTGPVWKRDGPAANATMLDSDDALLLRPVDLRDGYPSLDAQRPPIGAVDVPGSVVAGAVYHRAADGDGFGDFFRDTVEPALADTGAVPVAVFETLAAENNFPQLPLRDETVLVWLAVLADDTAYDVHRRALAGSSAWTGTVLPEIDRRSVAPPQQLRLRPTTRSAFR